MLLFLITRFALLSKSLFVDVLCRIISRAAEMSAVKVHQSVLRKHLVSRVYRE